MPRYHPAGDTLAHRDKFLIYFDRDDKCWVAHSLLTDQIGTGDNIITALADGYKAVIQIHRAVHRDPTLATHRKAPAAIQRKLANARKLPGEMADIAFKKATGKWPQDLSLNPTAPTAAVYSAAMQVA